MIHRLTFLLLLALCQIASAQSGKALTFQESPRFKSIRQEIDVELNKLPSSERPFKARTRALMAHKDLAASPKSLDRALRTLLYRAYALTEVLPTDLPAIDIDDVVKRAPGEVEFLRAKYLNTWRVTKIEKSRELRDALLKRDPKDFLVLLAASYDESWQGDPNMAITLAERAHKLEPTNYLTVHRLAIAYHYLYGKKPQVATAKKALAYYETWLKVAPQSAPRRKSIENRIKYLEGVIAKGKT
ncbi:MAG: hypothetical protein ACAH95_03315 [Fimbriimonas sp.]